ncbi:MAG: RNA polymerase sigma factor [Muribaculaceae bacterium]|nr:RNA polymerase sigma factor [Muribaculaceae bacterium]
MTNTVSDQSIINDVLGGDTRAFATIMERYAPRVYALVAGMMGDGDDAADTTQEIFIKVFSSLTSFKGSSSFSTWLFRISYNMVVSRLRKPQAPDSASGDDRFWNNIADTAADDDDDDTGMPTADMLYEALDQLQPDERTLISLFYLDDKSLAEIAFIMSITETNAKTRLFRIRKKLHKILSDGIRQ